jgi:hypothetical protein
MPGLLGDVAPVLAFTSFMIVLQQKSQVACMILGDETGDPGVTLSKASGGPSTSSAGTPRT